MRICDFFYKWYRNIFCFFGCLPPPPTTRNSLLQKDRERKRERERECVQKFWKVSATDIQSIKLSSKPTLENIFTHWEYEKSPFDFLTFLESGTIFFFGSLPEPTLENIFTHWEYETSSRGGKYFIADIAINEVRFAVCCSVLQCVAVRCSVLQCFADYLLNGYLEVKMFHRRHSDKWAQRSVLKCVIVCCSVLQCDAVCCSVLQCVAVCCNASSQTFL